MNGLRWIPFVCFWLSCPFLLAEDQISASTESSAVVVTEHDLTSEDPFNWPVIPVWPPTDQEQEPSASLPIHAPNHDAGYVSSSGGKSRGGSGQANLDPIFDHTAVTNVTAQLGETATLRCRVKYLGERPVSWVRRRDWHILTSGLFTYTNDDRFQVVHHEGDDDWFLQIRFVQGRDNGTYECQVSTGAGTISHYFNLHIIVPQALILGKSEYHIEQGSNINLVCIIENSPMPPQYVFWYHNERMVSYDTMSGRISVHTEPGPKTHSRLIINDVRYSDSGNYSCRASNAEPATIHVFVSEGRA